MLSAMQATQLTVGDRIFLIVLDKGVLALALASAVFFFNWLLQKQRQAHEEFLQKQKTREERFLQDQKTRDDLFLQNQHARDELVSAIAISRVDAYSKLWTLCEPVRFAQYHLKTVEERKEFDKKLDEWYYQEGGAMFLSWTASRRLMEARNRLRCIKHRTNSSQETKDIQKAFSRLRTQLKFDSGVINSEEKEEEVGDLLAWQLNEIE